jgi:hypothetical protein
VKRSAANLRHVLPRAFVAAAVVIGFVLLALHRREPTADSSLEQAIEPLATSARGCVLRGADALANARALERVAAGRWERVAFALEEAPQAAMQMAEAAACYAAAHDREARVRAEGLASIYAAEVERRFVRARLLLRVAIREQRADRVRAQVATLLALLASAPPGALAFRRELEQVARDHAAKAYERASLEEGTP